MTHRRRRAMARLAPALLVAATLGALPAADAEESALVGCPPLTGLVNAAPLPPRVGMSGSVTPFSPSDSAMFHAPVPLGGMRAVVRVTVTVQSLDFSQTPSVAYALYRVAGFDPSLTSILTCEAA